MKFSSVILWSRLRCFRTTVFLFEAFLLFCFILMPCRNFAGERYSVRKSSFGNPRMVNIYGLPRGKIGDFISTEEPFISRDGQFLFFNSGRSDGRKDLYYARKVKDRWVCCGPIGPGINSPNVAEASPTLDISYNFYYLNTAAKTMLSSGRFYLTTAGYSLCMISKAYHQGK